MILLKILSDSICPWCYIIKIGLDKGIDRFSSEILNVVWILFTQTQKHPKKARIEKISWRIVQRISILEMEKCKSNLVNCVGSPKN